MDGWINEWTDGRTSEWMVGQIDGGSRNSLIMNGRMNISIVEVCMDK